MTNRRYDVVLYGASGFVGRQTAQYFARYAPSGAVRWAIAGRDRQKLEAVRAQLGATAETVDVLVADSHDQAAIDAIVSCTRIVLNTAGPFALYATGIVDACVRFGTHYVDISGETPWVRGLIDRYHDRAAADGTRIIPCSGFDSVPSDLGTYLLVRRMQNELGVPCRGVKAYFQFYGGFNGGTLASSFNLHDSSQAARMREAFLLNPPGGHSHDEIERNRDPVGVCYDSDDRTWVGPYFMGPINTRVVRRSSALYDRWEEPYGPDFTYQEYIKYDGPFARLQAVAVTSGLALFDAVQRRPALRRLVKPLLPQPGGGPSEKLIEAGWFRCELLGLAQDGRKMRGLVCDQGDPSNRATVKCLCESALSLALNAEALPGGPARGGILTPATGLGDVLAQRLRRAGMTIAVGT